MKSSVCCYVLSVPVKDKVALMESWNKTTTPPTTPSITTNRQQVKQCVSAPHGNAVNEARPATNRVKLRSGDTSKLMESCLSRSMENAAAYRKSPRMARNTRHRRSMSDPNLPNSFQAMKKLWDKKVEQG